MPLGMGSFPSSGRIKQPCIHAGRKQCTRRNALFPLVTKIQISLLNYLQSYSQYCYATELGYLGLPVVRLVSKRQNFFSLHLNICMKVSPRSQSQTLRVLLTVLDRLKPTLKNVGQVYCFAILDTLTSGVMG